jgi:hypothetical protein
MQIEDHFNQGNEYSSALNDSPEFQEMRMRAEAAESKLRRIYNTPFWKLTKPLRKIYSRLREAQKLRQEDTFLFKPDLNSGTPVAILLKDKIQFESKNADLTNSSIAIVAQFSTSPTITESLARYIETFLSKGFSVVLVSACESQSKIQLNPEIKSKITLIRKPNLGYDFGSWAIALDVFPEILNANRLILTNDSLIGPLSSIDSIFESLENSRFDITGITDNSELQYHLQSYLLFLKENAIRNLNIQEFLKSVIHLDLKNEVILKYELGLTRTAQLSGLYVGALFPWNLIVKPGSNPSLSGWKRLIELGFPFLKKESVRRGSSREKSEIKQFISSNFPEVTWAIDEIKLIS